MPIPTNIHNKGFLQKLKNYCSNFLQSLEMFQGKLVVMLKHDLKIAFRNMRKYRSQTLISVVGLAVGFTCFALAMLWLRYEMTFDNFHKNAEHMYVVYSPSIGRDGGFSRIHNNQLAPYLKGTFPEVADAITLMLSYQTDIVIMDGIEYRASIISADTTLFRMFDVRILDGTIDFLIPGSGTVAITQKKARRIFGNESPIGKTVLRVRGFEFDEFTISAVVSDIPRRSNFAFDFISPLGGWGQTIIRLYSGIDVRAFEEKLFDHTVMGIGRELSNLTIKPITRMRYTDPGISRDIKFQYIVIFAISGLLVILCSLFNYLTLFLSRFRIRQKELALRVVCGASGVSLFKMLSVEFLLTLLFAVVLGGALTQLVHEPFLALSDIYMDLSAIYRESLVYIGGVILASLLVFWLVLFIFRRRSLNFSIRRSNKKMSRKVSVIIQLVISIGFAFCAIVIMKQIHFLHHTDELGFSFQNRGSVTIHKTSESGEGVLVNFLEQIPGITKVVNADGMDDLVRPRWPVTIWIHSWDEKPVDAEVMTFGLMQISPEFATFYNLDLVAGEMITPVDPNTLVLINQSAVRAFGWYDPVGKRFSDGGFSYTVKGVIRNIYNSTPTIEAIPTMYIRNRGRFLPRITLPDGRLQVSRVALFKYMEGMWESTKQRIEQMIEREFPYYNYVILNSTEEYNKLLRSENVLVRLLAFVSIICILVSIFGFVSLVSLTCEERRKEIAIRKVHGAMIGEILAMFAKEYFLLLFIGATIAFTAGYFIMQRWLEHYVIRTNIPAWIYLLIVSVLALVIVLCVGWQVYKSSIENPADVVKSE